MHHPEIYLPTRVLSVSLGREEGGGGEGVRREEGERPDFWPGQGQTQMTDRSAEGLEDVHFSPSLAASYQNNRKTHVRRGQTHRSDIAPVAQDTL